MKKTLIVLILVLTSCANYKAHYKTSVTKTHENSSEIDHTFYLIGDAGGTDLKIKNNTLIDFKKEISVANKNSTVLFLGDNIYPKGLPKKDSENYEDAIYKLNTQITSVENFKGQTVFIPGNHDWYSGIKGLQRQEKIIIKALGKNSFLPENGCPIEKIHINEHIELIVVDSHWYLTNWDKQPTINDDCEIKTIHSFLDEFSGLIKKSRNKTTIVAIHHPLFTDGAHGGKYAFKEHFKPFPVLGTLKNLIRRNGGVSNADLNHEKYLGLKKRLITICQNNPNVIFVSGHEHNLQYIEKDQVKQIVSGSGSKIKAVGTSKNSLFSYATHGFAKLEVYKDGSSKVSFYSSDEKKWIFESQVLSKQEKKESTFKYQDSLPKFKTASIYTTEETTKSKIHQYLWGDRYRKYYSIPVTVPVVNLDTLFGGVEVGRKGGGTQSKSLRLIPKTKDKKYVMRAMKKQGTQYIQASVYKDQYVEGQFKNTAAEDLIMDVFTGSHPYAPFVIADLSKAVGVNHLNPKLYYIPKQSALGDFNESFGDELYMIEEHASSGHGDKMGFGYSNEVISTHDMLKKIHKNENHIVDEKAYIRARLFDMLIGDWDRHQDQWRWLVYKENKKTIYRPLPRDRDQPFSKMSDGALLSTAVKIIPLARLLREYSDDLVDVKGVYIEPYPLDMEFIEKSDANIWLHEAAYIQENLTDQAIEVAFENMPKEVLDETIDDIKSKLKSRRKNLKKIANRYYNYLNKYVTLTGTNKSDYFEITRLDNGKTRITGYRHKGKENQSIMFDRTYDSKLTKEIWVYGLDGEDYFIIKGDGDDMIKIKLIGGQNKDSYELLNTKKAKLYDYKSKKNKILTPKAPKILTDNYETNVFNYKKLKDVIYQFAPSIGANPDDGFKIGGQAVITNKGFERNPFTTKQQFNFNYFSATNGIETKYNLETAYLIGKANFKLDIKYNSPNYSTNFFGYGNETENFNITNKDNFSMNYYRVKIQDFEFKPSLLWYGQTKSTTKLGINYSNKQIENSENRFINLSTNDTFSNKNFLGINAGFHFENKDHKVFPTLGFLFNIDLGYEYNLDDNSGLTFITPEIGFDQKIIENGKLVFATDIKSQINFGKNYLFYQAASIGVNNGLRGFRNQRFTGEKSFVQSTDIRYCISSFKTRLIPLKLGLYSGFDYGKVWLNGDHSENWHTSYGGGLFLNLMDKFTLNTSLFNANERLQFSVSSGWKF